MEAWGCCFSFVSEIVVEVEEDKTRTGRLDDFDPARDHVQIANGVKIGYWDVSSVRHYKHFRIWVKGVQQKAFFDGEPWVAS